MLEVSTVNLINFINKIQLPHDTQSSSRTNSNSLFTYELISQLQKMVQQVRIMSRCCGSVNTHTHAHNKHVS